jgi:Protein affecting phage T7 exclusion by the F plasmid
MVFGYLLALFVVLPIVELALLLKIGEGVGWPATIMLVVLTGVVGAALARWQGLQLLLRIQHELSEGRMPAPHLLDGLMIIVAAALLVTPGLITDGTGFLLLVPAFRRVVKDAVRRYLARRVQTGVIDVSYEEW